LSGFATGAICATSLALLLAPRAGSALRRHLADVPASLAPRPPESSRQRVLRATELVDIAP
jgi:gas vesicle protein